MIPQVFLLHWSCHLSLFYKKRLFVSLPSYLVAWSAVYTYLHSILETTQCVIWKYVICVNMSYNTGVHFVDPLFGYFSCLIAAHYRNGSSSQLCWRVFHLSNLHSNTELSGCPFVLNFYEDIIATNFYFKKAFSNKRWKYVDDTSIHILSQYKNRSIHSQLYRKLFGIPPIIAILRHNVV